MDKGYLLELIARPAFFVAGGKITSTNESARQRQITPGMSIEELLVTGKEEYLAMHDGCLFLTLCVSGTNYGASVTSNEDGYLFLLETDIGNKELQAVSLAAGQLREPMSNIMLIADRFLESGHTLPEAQLATFKSSLHKMLRTIYNMADASSYATRKQSKTTTENISKLVNELMEKVAATVEDSACSLSYQPLNENVLALCDKSLMERAILNLVSNAIKFSPAGSDIQVRLTKKDQKLMFTIENPCDTSGAQLKQDIFSRYLREPGIEDSRNGIGLGLVIVRAAAMAHSGTVLWEVPKDQMVRITLTITLQRSKSADVRSPQISVDRTGGHDKVLIELSDALPPDAYKDA